MTSQNSMLQHGHHEYSCASMQW